MAIATLALQTGSVAFDRIVMANRLSPRGVPVDLGIEGANLTGGVRLRISPWLRSIANDFFAAGWE